MNPPGEPPRLLLVGGGGGLVGRAVLAEFLPRWRVRSVHRAPVAGEAAAGVEPIHGDVGEVADWGPLLRGIDCVLTVAWYRWAREEQFVRLGAGLRRLIDAASAAGVRRFLHVSVPAAPPELERGLPYLRCKREVDAALAGSGLSYRILRPTLLFGRNDRLLGVMLRSMARYHLFPMFDAGEYHVSPLAAADLARALHRSAFDSLHGTVDLGGPVRYTYRELTDRMFAALGRPPRYLRMSRRTARRLAGTLVALGSTLIYPYEIDWLTSDLLGLAPYPGSDRPLERVEPYLEAEAGRLLRRRPEGQV
jgi:uncharacterized protein YbjT (DUF2867 family)